jgi:hypothetical protein
MSADTPSFRLDRLLGCEVFAPNKTRVGRLEEVRATESRGALLVTEYVIGAAGLMERLGLAVRLLLGFRTRGYVARWDQLDIRNPARPRLLFEVDDLRRL